MSNVDPVPSFLAILKANWNPANTDWGGTPRFTDSYEENGDFDLPHVVLLEPSEAPLGGGDTGFTAVQGSGKPMTRVLGTMTVITLAHERMQGVGDSAQLAFEMSQEVRRIVGLTYLEPVAGVEWWSFYARAGNPDVTRKPTIYRQECTLRYLYNHRL